MRQSDTVYLQLFCAICAELDSKRIEITSKLQMPGVTTAPTSGSSPSAW
jgi:hypothetical protein